MLFEKKHSSKNIKRGHLFLQGNTFLSTFFHEVAL